MAFDHVERVAAGAVIACGDEVAAGVWGSRCDVGDR